MAIPDLALISGIDIPIPEFKTTIHQPTIKEISLMGEPNFFSAIHYLSLRKEEIVEDETLLSGLTDFQVLMKVISQSETNEKKMSIVTLLTLLFPGYTPVFMPTSIILNGPSGTDIISINDDTFSILRDYISSILCVHHLFQGDNVVYNPANEKAKEIAKKIMRGRRIAASCKSKNQGEVFNRYISILTVGLQSMSLQDCLSLTVYQLFDLVERYSLYTNWMADFQIRMAGGQPKTEAENWMKNIH